MQRFAVEGDLAFIGMVDTGQCIEKCGLTSSVRAYDADNSARIQLEIDIVDGGQTAKTFYDVGCFK